MKAKLPKGQRTRSDFPRFGLTQFANRFPEYPYQVHLQVGGDVVASAILPEPLEGLPRVEQVSDFHCVTTWSCHALRWSGVRFSDFYYWHIASRVEMGSQIATVVLRGQDGYRTSLPLADLMAADVLLADTLDDLPLTIAHGAPLRLVAPAHYGYKSMKHLSRIEFWQGVPKFRPAAFAFMDHPRARVAVEERGRWLPGWLLRGVYKLLVRPTAARFAKAMTARETACRPPPSPVPIDTPDTNQGHKQR